MTESQATLIQPAVGSFCWYELNVPEPAAAQKFYGELFGWTSEEVPMGDFTYYLWKKDGVNFGGIMNTSGPEWKGAPPHWMTYVSVEDIDAAAAKVTELGGNVCVPPTAIPVGKFSVVSDPTGGTFTLFQEKTPEPIAQAMVWSELMTRDAAAAKSFYTKMFGWTTDTMPMGELGEYTMWANGGEPFAGMMQMNGPEFENIPPHWMNYVGVEDVDKTAARVSELGGKIVQPPMDLPNNVGRIAVICDPVGAHISMFQGGNAQC